MPDPDDQPKPDSFYQQQLEESLAASRATRARTRHLPPQQSLDVIHGYRDPNNDSNGGLHDGTNGAGATSVLGAIGSRGKFVLPEPAQPDLPPRQSNSTATPNDFTLYVTSDGKLGITNGTVNSVLPAGMSEGGTPAFAASVSGAGYAWLVLAWSSTAGVSSGVTSVSIGTGSSVPASTGTIDSSGNASGTYYQSLGDYSFTSAGNTIGSGAQGIGSQVTQACNNSLIIGPA